MTANEILDSAAIIALELKRIRESGSKISLLSLRNDVAVHLKDGLSLLAEVAGSEVETKCGCTNFYPYESSFIYEDVRFLQIGKTPEESRE